MCSPRTGKRGAAPEKVAKLQAEVERLRRYRSYVQNDNE
jgi:hypothetical protein